MLGKVGAFEFLCQRFFNSNKKAVVDEKMSIIKFRSAVESHHGVGICVSTRAHHGARDPQFTYVTPNVVPLDYCFIMCCVHLTEQPPVHSFREEIKGEWGRDASPHAPLRHLFIVAAATTNTAVVVFVDGAHVAQKKIQRLVGRGGGRGSSSAEKTRNRDLEREAVVQAKIGNADDARASALHDGNYVNDYNSCSTQQKHQKLEFCDNLQGCKGSTSNHPPV